MRNENLFFATALKSAINKKSQEIPDDLMEIGNLYYIKKLTIKTIAGLKEIPASRVSNMLERLNYELRKLSGDEEYLKAKDIIASKIKR